MKINICNFGNNEWFNFKSDIIFGLFFSLQKLGSDVFIAHNHIRPDCLNVIVGADYIPHNNQLVEMFLSNATSKNFDFCVFETEIFDGHTLNERPDFNAVMYLDLLSNAKFIFTPYQHNLTHYAERGIKLEYLKWGHNNGVRMYENTPDRHLFDACFLGVIKGLREQKLIKLQKEMGERLIFVTIGSPFQYREYGEVNAISLLSLEHKKPGNPVNPFRIQRALSNNKIVIHDHDYDLDGYTEPCFYFDPLAESVRDVLDRIKQDDGAVRTGPVSADKFDI